MRVREAPERPGPQRRRRLGIAAWLAIGWLATLGLLSLLAPVLPFADPDVNNVAIARQGPSPDAWLGGDTAGRDVLSRTVHGARSSLIIGIGAVSIGFLIGGSLALVAGYARGWTDTVVSTLFDVMLSVPALVLALAFTAFFGGTLANVVLALGVVAVPILGRITRASALAWSRREFVLAARARGARPISVLTGEVLPRSPCWRWRWPSSPRVASASSAPASRRGRSRGGP
jgi:peptide/nickel transport system permease protein